MTIYKITNKINNKIYIGQTIKSLTERFNKHIRTAESQSGFYLHNAIRKYGKENFIIEEIETCNSVEQLNKCEIYWIKNLKSLYPNGYNISVGGGGGDNFTNNPNKESIRNKMRNSKMGKNNSFYGKHHSDKTKSILKVKCKNFGTKNGFYGKHHTKKSKEKQVETYGDRTGINNPFFNKKHTIDTISRMRNKKLGKKLSDETRRKIGSWGKLHCKGEKNGNFTIYTLKCPDGDVYILNGRTELKKYVSGKCNVSKLSKLNKYNGYEILNRVKINKHSLAKLKMMAN